MRHMMALGVALAACMALPASAQTAATPADPAKSQQIVTQVCAGCHAADGNSVNPANPKLAGQPAAYLTKQLMDFKSGARKSPVMQGIAASLTPDDMKNLGVYYSEKVLKPGAAKDKALVEAGQKLYRGGNPSTGVPACAACHGPNGAGIPAQFPRLGSQFPEYTAAQLKNFRSGDRANDGAKMMRTIASRMTDAEIRAVSEYISGLH